MSFVTLPRTPVATLPSTNSNNNRYNYVAAGQQKEGIGSGSMLISRVNEGCVKLSSARQKHPPATQSSQISI